MVGDIIPLRRATSSRNDGRLEQESACLHGGEDLEQQKPQPADEEPEVVSGCCEDSVCGVSRSVSEIISVHPVLGFKMPDDGFDG
jgi:hypothetical protein